MSDADHPEAAWPRTCRGVEEEAKVLVQRLRERRSELALALGGRALSVEILVTPSHEPVRLGFGGEGFVTTLSADNPLMYGYSPDVVIRGTLGQVLGVLTADEPRPGSVQLSDPDAWPRFSRVHRIVAPELRYLI